MIEKNKKSNIKSYRDILGTFIDIVSSMALFCRTSNPRSNSMYSIPRKKNYQLVIIF